MGNFPTRGRNRPFSVAKAENLATATAAGAIAKRPFAWGDRSPWLAVVLGGVLMGLTPAPVHAWPLAWVALMPLWYAVVSPTVTRTRWQVFGVGCLWSGVYHGMVLSWITHLHPLTWMGVPWLASVAIALFAWVFITGLGTLTFGLWALVLRGVSDRTRLSAGGRILVGTALWCFLETALSWGPLYWPSLSFTQSPGNLWILHLGRLAGPMAVTAAIVAVNGCWAELLRTRSTPPPPNRLPWSLLLTGILLFLGLHGLGWSLYRQPLADLPDAALKIGLIQGNIPTRIKLTPAGTRQALMAYTEGYRALVAAGADAVLTPEGAVPEIWTRALQVRNPIRQAVIEAGKVLWLGTFRPVLPGTTQHLFQSLVTLDGQGQVMSQYNKVKLVPLGEYIPLEATLGRLITRLSPITSSLVRGTPDQLLETPFGPATVGICYESAYSELFRLQTRRGGQWIMTASNNDPYPPRMMMQHHAQDVMRAIESDRWAVRVTNTGISGVVTPHGETLWLSVPNQYVSHLAPIYRRQTQTLYIQWGNWLTYALMLAAVIKIAADNRKNT